LELIVSTLFWGSLMLSIIGLQHMNHRRSRWFVSFETLCGSICFSQRNYFGKVLHVAKFGKSYASQRLIFLNDVYGLVWPSTNPTGQLDDLGSVLLACFAVS
jgi:hypothetical protein